MGPDAPRFGIAPMKASSGDLPPAADDRWWYEVKWDGYRTLVFVDDGAVRLQSSNLIDVTKRWPELSAIGSAVNADSAVLDGEVAVLDDAGRPDFGRLARGEGPVSFLAFDLLAVNGTDTMGLPLEHRRRLLEQVLEPGDRWGISPMHDDGVALLAVTDAAGMEGVMAKRRDSVYLPGKRSAVWRKVKHRRRQEFVIVGWQAGEGNRTGTFGSLILAVVDDDHSLPKLASEAAPSGPDLTPKRGDGAAARAAAGVPLRFCGSVGSGFDERTLRSLTALLNARSRRDCPLVALPPKGAVTGPRWVEPGLVAEVAFAEWTIDGIIRHASFLGLRDDKSWTEVVRER